MKKAVLILVALILVFSCQKSVIDKPENLIGREKMINIMYDLSLLDAAKNQSIRGGMTSKEINEFIYKKYKIDSLQLVNSNKYYASDIDEYKKMYQEVKEKLQKEQEKINDTSPQNTPNTTDEVPTIM